MTVGHVITMSVIGVTMTGCVVVSMSVDCSVACISTMGAIWVRSQVFNYDDGLCWGAMTVTSVTMTSVTCVTSVTSETVTSMTVTAVAVARVSMIMAMAMITVAVVMTRSVLVGGIMSVSLVSICEAVTIMMRVSMGGRSVITHVVVAVRVSMAVCSD